MEYEVNVAKAGKYELSAQVVTANYDQKLFVSANDKEAVMKMPFTLGSWKECEPVTLALKEGVNTLRFLRRPSQYGMAVKSSS